MDHGLEDRVAAAAGHAEQSRRRSPSTRARCAQATPGARQQQRRRILAACWAHYIACDRQLLELTPPMLQILRGLNRDDRPPVTLEPPFPAFFIHLGQQPDLRLTAAEPQLLVDGAFFSFSQDRDGRPLPMSLCLTGASERGASPLMAVASFERFGPLMGESLEVALT